MPLHGEPLEAPLAKPEPRRKAKDRKARQTVKKRIAAREAAIDRAESRCQRCGIAVSDYLPDWHPQRTHVNEMVPRSLGGSAIDLDNVEVLCRGCHMPNGRHAPTAERMRLNQRKAGET